MSLSDVLSNMTWYMTDFLSVLASWLVDCKPALIFVGLSLVCVIFGMVRKLVHV